MPKAPFSASNYNANIACAHMFSFIYLYIPCPWMEKFIQLAIIIIIHNYIMYIYGATCTCVFMAGGARKVYKV